MRVSVVLVLCLIAAVFAASRSAPRPAPRPAPRAAPRSAPRSAPRAAPRAAPRSAPKSAPRSAPRAAPKAAPRAAPRSAPRSAPRAAPKSAPRSAPRAAPKSAPRAAPRSAPKSAPRSAPKAAPRAAPKSAPRASPKTQPKATTPKKSTPTKTQPKATPVKTQPKAAVQPKTAVQPKAVTPSANGLKVDHDFIKKQEAMKYSMYVPKNKKGEVIGKSGATIANGLDLGQRTNLNDLKAQGLDASTAAKLQPYLGMKKADAAEYVKSHPLTLTKAEGDNLAKVVSATYDRQMANNFKKTTGKDFSALPSNVQTALASVGHQYGSYTQKSGAANVAKLAAAGDYSGAAKALQGMDQTYKNRRNEEAALMRA